MLSRDRQPFARFVLWHLGNILVKHNDQAPRWLKA